VASSRVAYVDASALVKLVLEEPESRALHRHLHGQPLASSEVALVEVTRASRRATPDAARRARQLLQDAFLIEVDRAVLDHAAELASERIRTLDAIHLASALSLGPDEFVAYDHRLLEAAAGAGLTVSSPGA
jgi:uncharacterized protein